MYTYLSKCGWVERKRKKETRNLLHLMYHLLYVCTHLCVYVYLCRRAGVLYCPQTVRKPKGVRLHDACFRFPLHNSSSMILDSSSITCDRHMMIANRQLVWGVTLGSCTTHIKLLQRQCSLLYIARL